MSMKRVLLALFGLAVAIALVRIGLFYWDNLRGVGPAIREIPADVDPLPHLSVPSGFSIAVFAENLPDARVMAMDRFGNMWVSQTRSDRISLLEVADGAVQNQTSIFMDLRNPHGIAFDPQNGLDLYIAEEHQISRVRTYSEGPPEKIADLPPGGRHTTRTIAFGPDDRLYVSIGSSCDVCHEDDPRRGAILSMERNGSDIRTHATGLRNAVFFDWSPVDGRLWVTEMGRDFLGDDLPPDEINIVTEGGYYGWPICYGKNIHDTAFDKNTYIRNPCMEPFEFPSHIDLPAHSAPLGLAFIPEEGWPEEYWYDLLVAYHGSWNRSEPTGYKIVRIELDAEGNPPALGVAIHDFISGWLTDDDTAIGRPVDLLIQPGGILYISDDKSGTIYRLTRDSL